MRRVGARRHQQVAAAAARAHAQVLVAGGQVHDIDRDPVGAQRADDPVARFRHPAALRREGLGEPERPHESRWLGPDSPDHVWAASASSNARTSYSS